MEGGAAKALHLTCTKLIGVEKAIQILSIVPIAMPFPQSHPVSAGLLSVKKAHKATLADLLMVPSISTQ